MPTVVQKAHMSRIPSRAIFITPPFSEKAAPTEGRKYGMDIRSVCRKKAYVTIFSIIYN